jgi:hypothetical protein
MEQGREALSRTAGQAFLRGEFFLQAELVSSCLSSRVTAFPTNSFGGAFLRTGGGQGQEVCLGRPCW